MMNMTKVLIADDDFRVRKVVENILHQHFPRLKVIAQTDDVESTISAINSLKPEIAILDLHLFGGTAFDVVKNLVWKNFQLILISAYQDCFLNNIRLAGIDFVYKPLDVGELIVSVDKLVSGSKINKEEYYKKIVALDNNFNEHTEDKEIVFQVDTELLHVPVSELVCGKSNMSSSKFFFQKHKTINIHQPLRRFEPMLADEGFFRCHSLYIVNYNKIQNINYEIMHLEMSNGMLIPFEMRRLEKYTSPKSVVKKLSRVFSLKL